MKPNSTDDSRLQAYLDGELGEDERTTLEAELAADARLRRKLDRLRAASALAQQSAPPAPPPDLLERIQARVAAGPIRWWQRCLPGHGRAAPTMAWGVASTFLLALLMLPLTDLSRPSRDLDVTVPDSAATRIADDFRPTEGLAAIRVELGATEATATEETPATAAPPAAEVTDLAVHAADSGRTSAPARPALGREDDTVMAGDVVAEPPLAAPLDTIAVGRGSRAADSETVAGTRFVAEAQAAEAPETVKRPVRDQAAKGAPGTAPTTAVQTQPALQAGEIDDNEKFAKYVEYVEESTPSANVRRFDVRERYVIQVVGKGGVGMRGYTVRVFPDRRSEQAIYTARTDSSGQAVFFPGISENVPQQVYVSASPPPSERRAETPKRVRFRRTDEGGVWRVEAPGNVSPTSRVPLDIAFVVDTTGSMSEEIDRIRDTIDEVAARINELPAQPRLRLGLVLYRDRGDDYVTKVYPFTADVTDFRGQLENVTANGGGDTPEDVNAALAATVSELNWDRSAGDRQPVQPSALRLAFLIGDAPPHLDYQDGVDYFSSVQAAAAMGIKFFAISSSDNDDIGEYVWRQLALLTRGRFLFITKGGAAGITPHHVERQDYTVQALPDLILNCVARELASLGKKPGEPVTFELPPRVSVPRPVVEPQPEPAPVHRDQPTLPLWAYFVILAVNLAGWAYAYRRSVRPLREDRPRPDAPRWQPPADHEPDGEDETEET